jgi:hypothetical protein
MKEIQKFQKKNQYFYFFTKSKIFPLSYFPLEFWETRIWENGLWQLKSDVKFCVDTFSYIILFLSPYAKVIAVLIQNNLFCKKYRNSNFQIFPKSWLREVHACQRILKFEFFIIFFYFFMFFLRVRGKGEAWEEKNGRQPFNTGLWLKPVLKVPLLH